MSENCKICIITIAFRFVQPLQFVFQPIWLLMAFWFLTWKLLTIAYFCLNSLYNFRPRMIFKNLIRFPFNLMLIAWKHCSVYLKHLIPRLLYWKFESVLLFEILPNWSLRIALLISRSIHVNVWKLPNAYMSTYGFRSILTVQLYVWMFPWALPLILNASVAGIGLKCEDMYAVTTIYLKMS